MTAYHEHAQSMNSASHGTDSVPQRVLLLPAKTFMALTSIHLSKRALALCCCMLVASTLLASCTDEGDARSFPPVITQEQLQSTAVQNPDNDADAAVPNSAQNQNQDAATNPAATNPAATSPDEPTTGNDNPAAPDNTDSDDTDSVVTETESAESDNTEASNTGQNNTAQNNTGQNNTVSAPPAANPAETVSTVEPTTTPEVPTPADPPEPVATPTGSGNFANTDLGVFVPTTTPRASTAPAPRQPDERAPVATESSPPIPPVTTASALVDQTLNSAPYFENLNDTVAFAGQTMRLRVVPRDADGNLPGMFTGPLPDGARWLDNFDGTKTIEWRPLEPDVGMRTIDITAIDAIEPSYRTRKTVRIFVKLPDDLSTIETFPPAIDLIRPHRARAGDKITMLVKGTDPNGYVPFLEVLTPPANASFEIFPEDDRIRVFSWQTGPADDGVHNLRFRVTDAKDPTLTAERVVTLELSRPEAFIRPGPRLRALAETHQFHIGFAALMGFQYRPDGVLYEDTGASEFNIVTTENSVKWGQLNPEPNQWRWDAFDREMQFAHTHQLLLHGHTLVWHRQLPAWIKELPLHKVEGVMLDYISHVVGRYGAHVPVWDVVNESFEENGTFRQSVWYQALGEGYIEKAFRQAHLTSPQSRLIYNDYDVAWEGPKADAMYQLVTRLLADGVPVHGVGFQMHVDSNFNRYDSVQRNFQRFADLGLEIFITELDVSTPDGDGSNHDANQATVYRDILSLCLAQPACKALQVWGLTDRYSWRRDRRPLLLDQDFNAKSAYYSLQQRLSGGR